MITVVSTASKQGLLTYGECFLDSFTRYWPYERLIFYTDGYKYTSERIEFHDLYQSSSWLARFKQEYANHPRANGQGGYRWDAIRFSHKVAAILAADDLCTDDHLLWLDADIVTHNAVTEEAIKSWLPGKAWLSWLDRNPKVIGWPECGFLLFNRNHRLHRTAMMMMFDLYYTGRVLNLPETHDSYVWKWLVEGLGVDTTNLSGPGFGTMHPLINSPLGHWFDHLKGSRKLVGHSYPGDLHIKRDEAYWKGIV